MVVDASIVDLASEAVIVVSCSTLWMVAVVITSITSSSAAWSESGVMPLIAQISATTPTITIAIAFAETASAARSTVVNFSHGLTIATLTNSADGITEGAVVAADTIACTLLGPTASVTVLDLASAIAGTVLRSTPSPSRPTFSVIPSDDVRLRVTTSIPSKGSAMQEEVDPRHMSSIGSSRDSVNSGMIVVVDSVVVVTASSTDRTFSVFADCGVNWFDETACVVKGHEQSHGDKERDEFDLTFVSS